MAVGILFMKSEGKYCDLYRVNVKVGVTRFKLGEFILRKGK